MIRYDAGSWDRMIRALEKVRERLTRAARALEAAFGWWRWKHWCG